MSTSVNSANSCTVPTLRRRPSRVRAPVSGCDMGIPVRNEALVGSDSPSAHQPPSVAGPNTPSTAGSASVRADSSSSRAPTCGVSIPICRTGPPTTVAESAWAATSRSPRPVPRCGTTWNLASTLRNSSPRWASPRSPVSATTRAAASTASTASSVSSRAAAASDAAASAPTVAANRVLARPGTGAFATTNSVHDTRLIGSP